jgi:6-phosphogluconate dehydrogenase
MSYAKIGVIGMAVMGQNLARNFASREITTVVYNRTTQTMTDFIEEHGNNHLSGEESLEGFIAALEKPRRILLMVKAGQAVDTVINLLTPLLEKDDIIIDGGNSQFSDTTRRSKLLEEKGIHFVGMGVSGGEKGALNGPSLMPGGTSKSWESLKPLLESIAAKDFSGKPCVTHIGTDGAGHYVKMVHNGIEYAVMQLMAEAYDILRKSFQMTTPEIADTFESFGNGRLKSYLFDIVVPVLKKKDEESGDYLINIILDKAGQKGTGKWTAIDALDRGVTLSIISEAVFARVSSSQKETRSQLEKKYDKHRYQPSVTQDEMIVHLEAALYAGMILCYAQGFDLIKTAAEENNWDINFPEVARIWQGGCIIRADLLKFLMEAFSSSPEKYPNLLSISQIQKSLQKSNEALKQIVSTSALNGIATPCFSSSLNYYEGMTTSESPANLIQGLRDYFGAHTYERKDKEGTFHTQWE